MMRSFQNFIRLKAGAGASLLALGILIAGCGRNEDGAPAAPEESAEVGYCEIKISGDRTLNMRETQRRRPPNASVEEAERAGNVGAQTDYWLTDAELRNMIGVLNSGKDVEQLMGKDPKVTPLFINCFNDVVALHIQPGEGSKYADVPMKPKRYTLVDANKQPGSLGNPGGPGEFSVFMLMIKGKPDDRVYATSAPGILDITQFDAKNIKGTFSFKARQLYVPDRPENISVSGSFSLACDSDKCR